MSGELEEVQRRLVVARAELDRATAEASRGATSFTNQASLNLIVGTAEKDVADLELIERRLLDAKASRDAEFGAAMARLNAEDRAFWVRRFHTSLAIAHGAAFVALASHLFDGDQVRLNMIAGATFTSMSVFGTGMLLAGAIPFVMYRGSPSAAERLAFASAGLFVIGVVAALIGVYRAAGLVLPF